MGPSQLTWLRKHDIRPVKRRGQHFLIDGNLARWIAGEVLKLGRNVLELGAGAGALTVPLLAAGASVTGVEVDRRLCALLRCELSGQERFRLLQDDFKQLDWRQALEACGPRPVVTGNLPYVLTSTVLFELAAQRGHLAGAVLMVQKEVAERLTSAAGHAEYGVLSVVLGSLFAIEAVRTVPATVFWPRPEVASCVVRLLPQPGWTDGEFRFFAATVKRLFSQRRKKVGTILRSLFDIKQQELTRFATAAGFDPERRPEQLAKRQLRALSRALAERDSS